MKLKFALLTSLTIFFTQPTLAEFPPMPDKCPSLTAIASAEFDKVMEQENHLWTVEQHNQHYDTTDNWSFSLNNIEAKDATDAIEKAKNIIPTLHVYYGPDENEEDKTWECWFKDNLGHKGIAVTPSKL